jgi:hypothetical protein
VPTGLSQPITELLKEEGGRGREGEEKEKEKRKGEGGKKKGKCIFNGTRTAERWTKGVVSGIGCV